MSWITDRLPTEDDADCREWVATWTDSLQMINYKNIGIGDPWYPLPKPYVAPKPKRAFYNDALGIPFAEVLPGDPADWDTLLAAIDSNEEMYPKLDAILKARKPKEGE